MMLALVMVLVLVLVLMLDLIASGGIIAYILNVGMIL